MSGNRGFNYAQLKLLGVETTASGEIPNCPDFGKPMIKRSGKFGEIYDCSDFHKCRGTVNIK